MVGQRHCRVRGDHPHVSGETHQCRLASLCRHHPLARGRRAGELSGRRAFSLPHERVNGHGGTHCHYVKNNDDVVVDDVFVDDVVEDDDDDDDDDDTVVVLFKLF